MSQPLDLSLTGRYRTIWPTLVTRLSIAAASRVAHRCTFGRSRWVRVTTATVLASIPVALIATGWLVCAVLCVLWPFGWLYMLPTRIAVRRDVTQLHAIYALCWVSCLIVTGWAWWIALVLAYRDPKPATA